MSENSNTLAEQWAAYSARLSPQEQQQMNQLAAIQGQYSPQQIQQAYAQQQWMYQQLITGGYTAPTPEAPKERGGGRASRAPFNGGRERAQPYPSHSHSNTHNTHLNLNSSIELPKESFTCQNCDKNFGSHVTYMAHMSAHKKCSMCNFHSLSKRLAEHIADEHNDKDARSLVPVSQESPEDIAAWIEQRKRKYPNAERVKPTEVEAPRIIVSNPRATSYRPCKFFMKGKCLKGDDCPFQHPITTLPPKPVVRSLFENVSFETYT